MKPSQIIREISEIFGNAIVLKVRRFAKKKNQRGKASL